MGTWLSTEGLARRAARRPWLTVGAWVVALLVAGFLIVNLLGDALTTEDDFSGTPESKQAELLIDERLPTQHADDTQELLIVRSGELTVDDPAFQERVDEVVATAQKHEIESLVNYYDVGDESLVSPDRDTIIFPIVLADESDENVDALVSAIHEENGVNGFETYLFGEFSVDADFREVAESDLQRGELFGVAIALVVLLLVFGAVVASLVPVILAVVSIAVALGLTTLVGQAFELSFFVVNMLVMMGLAVGIDYALFVVSRFREERAKGREKQDAIAISGATATRAVFFSGITVVLALLGMLLVPTTIFRSLATGAILVVLVAVAAALTLLPAVLSLLGDRVNSLRIPFVRRKTAVEGTERGFWAWAARRVMRRPVISLVVSVAILLAAASPYLGINTGFSGVETLPDSFQSKQGFVVLDEEYPDFGEVSPVEIAVDGDLSDAGVQEAIAALETGLAADGQFGSPELIANDAGDFALLAVPLVSEPSSEEAVSAVERARVDYVPAAFDGVPAEAFVGGATAENVDFFEITDTYLPIVIAFVLGLSFILLMLAFRSVVVPATSIVMNLLSVGAAYGLLVLVFQEGIGTGLFGFQQVTQIEAWIPLFLFTVLFGLSMDYHVFLLSRIRERYSQTGDNTGAVAYGVGTTSRIITGAALIMVAVFAGFASGELVMFQQMGFGLAVAVLLDATLVRSVLVPATMRLLGDRNWYFPSWLEWLPKVQVEAPAIAGPAEPAPQAVYLSSNGHRPESPAEREPAEVGDRTD